MMTLPVRGTSERSLLGGVCSGLSTKLRIEPAAVRVLFVILALIGGLGVIAYVVAWAGMPASDISEPEELTVRKASGLFFVALTTFVVLHRLGFAAHMLLLAVGILILWKRQPGSPYNVFSRFSGNTRPNRSPGVTAIGVTLLAIGSIAFLHAQGTVGTLKEILPAIAITLVGTIILFGAWWRDLLQAFEHEKEARIRSQERAEVAAHLHDSVLQTLALIQRHTNNPDEITTLARRQERELRAWISEENKINDKLFAAHLTHTAATVEESYNVKIEVVTVGDCQMTGNLEAAVAASKEALVNAARFAGNEQIDVFAEASTERCTIFVRDHGPGFDVNTTPDDHHGVRESIIGRMERHGGSATIRSNNDGTEIELNIPCK